MGSQATEAKPRRVIDTAHAPGTPSSHIDAMRQWLCSKAGQAAQRRFAAPTQPAPVVVAKLALMFPRAGESPSPEKHERHMTILNMFNRTHGGYDTLGGKRDPQDQNLLSALLRELCEELGCRTAAGEPDVAKLKATYLLRLIENVRLMAVSCRQWEPGRTAAIPNLLPPSTPPWPHRTLETPRSTLQCFMAPADFR